MQRVLNLTNQFRAANGLAPLQLNIELDAAALGHSQDMALNDYFDHNGLNGSTPASRINQVGYVYSIYIENIAAGYDTPEEVVQGWIDSPEHRANLLNSSFTEVGIGYYYLANDTGVNNYYSYWTQNFGGSDLNPASYV
ncbi:CAP domain-containing protein [Leptodesmis sp.]|uniref:CAP domain-containing protein n=1 Tax=Leptodesmis sp. TaxID=3100501 RepID=UPI004053543A